MIEQDILSLLSRSAGLTTHAIAERLAISISTASKYLEALKREGLVLDAAVGPAKRWRLRPADLADFEHFRRHLTASNGTLKLFNHRTAMVPAESFAALLRALEQKSSAREALYAMGLPLGERAAAATKPHTTDHRTHLHAGLHYLAHKGWGKPLLTHFDGQRLLVRVSAPLLAEHANRADHLLAGALAGLFQSVTGRAATATETRCKASGHPHCEFVVTPK